MKYRSAAHARYTIYYHIVFLPKYRRKVLKHKDIDKELKDTPVIVISGIDGDHAIRKAVAFVAKPFDPEKLIGIVKNTIG